MAANWSTLVASGSALRRADSPPTFVIFSDYECAACRDLDGALDSLAPRMRARIVYHHLPIGLVHPSAEAAARAAICAEAQGAFPAMHRFLMRSADWVRTPDWNRAARESGVADVGAFGECLNNIGTKVRLDRMAELARSMGIRSTPTMLTPDQVYEGGVAIRRALAATHLGP